MPNSRRFCYSLLVVLLAWILPSCSSRSIQRSAEDVPEDVWSYANRLLPMPTQKADACGGRSRHQLNGKTMERIVKHDMYEINFSGRHHHQPRFPSGFQSSQKTLLVDDRAR